MANVIKHKRGSGSDPAANNLVIGELAIRTDTGKLFTKMDSGAIAEIAGGGSDIAINTLSASSGSGGNNSGVFDNSATRFTLSSPPNVSAAQLLVSVNGVIQKPVLGTGTPSEGFSIDGNDIIFSSAPETGADFFILTFRSLGVSEPADNSVTSAKIVDGAIVNADINASAAIAKSKLASLDIVNADVNASAAIAGTKINPSFTSNISINNSFPSLFLTDTEHNSDFSIQNQDGTFAVKDETNTTTRLTIASNGATTLSNTLTVGGDITSTTGDLTLSSGSILATDLIPATFKNNVTGTSSVYVLIGNNTQTYAFQASSSGFSINDYTNVNTARFSIDSSGNSKVHKDLIIESNFPRIFFTDNDSNPDYSITNANGKFAIHDETNSADRLTIETTGVICNSPFTINNGLFVGGTSVSGGEGGEIQLTQAPNSTLAGNAVVFDQVNNMIRFFESAVPFKGAFLDIGQQGNGVTSQIMTSTTAVTYTGAMTFGSGATIDLSTNDVYLNARVINNQNGGTDDGLYLGYNNANQGVTRLYGGGGSTNHLVFDNTQIYPVPDNTIALGAGTHRYTNLFVSGGVNFGDASGGTSYSAGNDANTLDDYEEGTWTPSYVSFTNVGTTNSAKYVKIGQVVHISFNNFQNNNNMAVNGLGAYINGLPFPVDDIQGIFIGGYANKDVSGSYVVTDGTGNRIILGAAVTGMRHIWAGFTYRTTA